MHKTTEKLLISDQHRKSLTFLINSCQRRVLTVKKILLKHLFLQCELFIYRPTSKYTAAFYLSNVSDHDCWQKTSLIRKYTYIKQTNTFGKSTRVNMHQKINKALKPQERRFLRQSACNPGKVWLQHYQSSRIFLFASQQSLSKTKQNNVWCNPTQFDVKR